MYPCIQLYDKTHTHQTRLRTVGLDGLLGLLVTVAAGRRLLRLLQQRALARLVVEGKLACRRKHTSICLCVNVYVCAWSRARAPSASVCTSSKTPIQLRHTHIHITHPCRGTSGIAGRPAPPAPGPPARSATRPQRPCDRGAVRGWQAGGGVDQPRHER